MKNQSAFGSVKSKNKLFFLLLFLLLIPNTNALSDNQCEDLYFLVAKTNYRVADFQLDEINVSKEDLYYYGEECRNSKYPELPEMKVKKILVDKRDLEEVKNLCDYSVNPLFKPSFPFPDIEIGENPSCRKINLSKYFFKMEDNRITQIRVIWIVFTILAAIFIYSRDGKIKEFLRR